MSREQLDRAYTLVKSGQMQEAIDIIEAVIRADRDNENAWWLLVNATSDPAAKRNALNNVIRLTQNQQRTDKAQAMLQALDNDPYNFDDKSKMQGGMSSYQSPEKSQQNKSGSGCGKIVIGAMVVIGLCACISIFGIFLAAGPIISAVQMPDSYDSQGILEGSFDTEGSIRADEPTDGYIYRGTAGERLLITVTSNSETAPFLIIFEVDTGLPIAYAQTQAFNQDTSVSTELPRSGEYLIVLRGLTFLGQDLGYGDYSMSFEVR